MKDIIDFSKMEFYDFYSLKTNNSHIVMCDDCYMCQECYYR